MTYKTYSCTALEVNKIQNTILRLYDGRTLDYDERRDLAKTLESVLEGFVREVVQDDTITYDLYTKDIHVHGDEYGLVEEGMSARDLVEWFWGTYDWAYKVVSSDGRLVSEGQALYPEEGY